MDVNPNQDLRFKEILKTVLPGANLWVYVYLVKVISGQRTLDWCNAAYSSVSNLKGGMLFSIALVVVFMSGYIINLLSSYAERTLYKCERFKRPSKVILNYSETYSVHEIDIIRNEFKGSLFQDVVCNDQAKKILNIIKGRIQRKDNLVEDFYHRSIMGRNFCGSQIIATILSCLLVNGIKCSCLFWAISILLAVAYGLEWRRMNCIYVKNIFLEYIRELHEKTKT